MSFDIDCNIFYNVTFKTFDRGLCDKHELPLYVTFMAENHGKGKWDGAGGFFSRTYLKDGVLNGRDKNRDLTWYANWFNSHRSKPKHCKCHKIHGKVVFDSNDLDS